MVGDGLDGSGANSAGDSSKATGCATVVIAGSGVGAATGCGRGA